MATPVHGLPIQGEYNYPIGTINISATIPDSPSSVIAYQVIPDPNNIAYYSASDLEKVRLNVTSEADAPQVAQNILNNYGGLPPDAVLTLSSTEYLIEMNGTTNEEITRSPVSTNVQYGRKINDVPVVGDGACINMELGDNGELLYLNKVWRTVTPDGNLSIQPVSVAINKLRNGEMLNPKKDSHDVNITKIRLGYFEKGMNQSEDYLEPAWLFKGNTETGDPIQYYVYARHFSNFTASQTNISMYQTVQFTDISDTTPTKWYWDFGDGTNSTEQNPSHIYTTAGNFTVNLTAWNDLGSDIETKPDYIAVNFNKPLNADFNATPTVGSYPMDVQFYDLTDSSPDQWFWDFGDGTNSTEQNPLHTYQSGGNFTVNLTAWNALGSDTVSRENYIYIYSTPAPVAGFTSNFSWDNTQVPLPVAFSDTTTGNITTWFWDFGDGMNSTEQNPVHIFNISQGELWGYFPITLTLTDNYGRVSSCWDYIVVYRPFDVNFTVEPQQGLVPLNVTFTETSMRLNNYYRYSWDFGDGNSSEWHYRDADEIPRTINHEYTSNGNYIVTLTIWANSDMRYTTSKDVIVGVSSPTPAADFVANTTYGKEPLAVSFRDLSSGYPTSWNWTFGDGTTVGEKNPIHVFTVAGNYTVSLEAANDSGNNTTIKTDYITVLPSNPPVADFTANTTAGKSPLAVAFNDNSTNSPVNWSWDFGDDANSTDQNPVHMYSTPGKYTVSLRVMNNDGSDILTRTYYITVLMELPTMTIVPPSPVLPVSNFSATPLSGKEPLTVIFNDSSTGIPENWLWSFGDGGTSSESDPVYNYTSAGNYTVSLTTTNPYGNNSTTRVNYIAVSPLVPPSANFTATPLSGKAPLTVIFNDTTTGSPVQWTWDFGDEKNSSVQNPVHQYISAGTYSVTLTATNPDGSDTRIRTNYITVTALTGPVANFTAQPSYGKAPLKVTFNDTSSGSPTQWDWTFGDGTNSTVQNPVHTYTANGKYTVLLTATNAGGNNTKIRTEYIIVSCSANPPVAKFIAAPTCGTAPLNVKFTDTSTGYPTQWYWTFGDGTNATEQNPAHIYTSAGKFTVSLTATNSLGTNTRTEKEFITVKSIKPPSADFSGKPTSGRAPLAVVFSDTSTGSPTSWYWEFGDGTNSTIQNPVHTFLAAGKYTVSMTASNTGGSDTKSRNQYISISAPTPAPTPPTTTIRPTTTCTTKPTTTCTIKVTTTTTAEPPCPTPHVTGTAGNDSIRLDWDAITDSRLQGYKVVISKSNSYPEYPDDGYMYGITDRSQNSSVIDTKTIYNGGDIGRYLKPGQSYYFSVTAVYTNTSVPGNVVQMMFPGSVKTKMEVSEINLEPADRS